MVTDPNTKVIAPKPITKENDPVAQPTPVTPVIETPTEPTGPVVPVNPVVSDAEVKVIEQDIAAQDDAKITALKAEMTATMDASIAALKAEYETKLATEKTQILEEVSSRKGLVSQPPNPYEAPPVQQPQKEVTNADIITHMKNMSGDEDSQASEVFRQSIFK